MAVEINKITGVVRGQYGEAIQMTIVNKQGIAQDVSSYNTTKTITCRDKFTLKTFDSTVTFVSSGTDGKVQFTPVDGNFDRAGEWLAQIELTKTGVVAYTVPFTIVVEEKLKA